VINNQSAVLKVAENSVYFRLKYNRYIRSKDAGGDVVLTSSDIQTVPIGLILTVQPSIHAERGEITLALRPTVTSSSKVMRDPAVEIASQNTVESVVPIVEVREIDSILHMKDGEVVILGGLMQEKLHDNSSGLPGLRRIPGLGAAFRGDQTEHDIVELVIFLKATILKPPALQDT
ncbi:MAG: type II and III secretion system protein, partial [Alphaproteobacteria bacterium]|nr:type II and III secretion system protein [Alphaproteobacteria bacterium]